MFRAGVGLSKINKVGRWIYGFRDARGLLEGGRDMDVWNGGAAGFFRWGT